MFKPFVSLVSLVSLVCLTAASAPLAAQPADARLQLRHRLPVAAAAAAGHADVQGYQHTEVQADLAAEPVTPSTTGLVVKTRPASIPAFVIPPT